MDIYTNQNLMTSLTTLKYLAAPGMLEIRQFHLPQQHISMANAQKQNCQPQPQGLSGYRHVCIKHISDRLSQLLKGPVLSHSSGRLK